MENVITIKDNDIRISIDVNKIERYKIFKCCKLWNFDIWQKLGQTFFTTTDDETASKINAAIISPIYIHAEDMPFEVHIEK